MDLTWLWQNEPCSMEEKPCIHSLENLRSTINLTFLPILYVNPSLCQYFNISICQSVNLPVCHSVNPSIYQSANLPMFQSANIPIFQSANISICQSSNLPIFQSANLPDFQSANLPIWQSPDAPQPPIQSGQFLLEVLLCFFLCFSLLLIDHVILKIY